MNRVVVLVVVASLAIATATALALAPLFEVRIKDEVKVPSALKVVEVELDIETEEGSRKIQLGEIKIPSKKIIARVVLDSKEGEFTAVISGVLVLEAENRSYEISMPCAISIGEPCYRVMVLIPGYDTPMEVEEGTYRATLELSWIARGSGKFSAKLLVEEAE